MMARLVALIDLNPPHGPARHQDARDPASTNINATPRSRPS